MRLPILAVAALAATATTGPAPAQSDPASRIIGYITGRYLDDFEGIRRQIAQLELLNACGERDLVAQLVDGLVAEELTIRRKVLADIMALESDTMPEPKVRREVATTLLDALGIADSTTRGLMLDLTTGGTPPAQACDAARDALQARLSDPQPTSAKP